MFPTIADEDVLLIDEGQREPLNAEFMQFSAQTETSASSA